MIFNILKAFHIMSVILWAGASSSLGLFAIIAYEKGINCDYDYMWKFYKKLVNLELFGFIMIIFFGIGMYSMLGFKPIPWLMMKLPIVFGFFLPAEILNIYFLHVKNDIKTYGKFIKIISPFLIIAGMCVILLAVIRPS